MDMLSSLAKELRDVFGKVAERQGKNRLYQTLKKTDWQPVYQGTDFWLVGEPGRKR